MNVLDENIAASQRTSLRRWRIPFRQIGQDIGRLGLKDSEIIPLLLELPKPTFFTRDRDFWKSQLCHERYCLVFLDSEPEESAEYIRRILRHSKFDTKAKRMGTIICAAVDEMQMLRVNQRHRQLVNWED